MHPSTLLKAATGLAALSATGVAAHSRPEYDSGLDLQFTSCSSKEEKVFARGIEDAAQCLEVIIALRMIPDWRPEQYQHEKTLRKRYFGNAAQWDEDEITKNFISMLGDIDSAPYHCGDKYVWTDEDGRTQGCAATSNFEEMTTCPQFFLLNDEERRRVTIHELSHANGAAKDFVYGEEDVQQLAFDDPARAAHNADNYAWYANAVCRGGKKGRKLPKAKKIDYGDEDGKKHRGPY